MTRTVLACVVFSVGVAGAMAHATPFTNYTTADGLGSNAVSGVYASGSTAYAATSSGLSISTDGGLTYTIADGLGSNTINGVDATGSAIYAATANGLSIAVVPEPSSLVMGAVGLSLLAWRAFRRRRS